MKMQARYPGKCHCCGHSVAVGDRIDWAAGAVRCVACFGKPVPAVQARAATRAGTSYRRSGRCRECGGAVIDAPEHRAMGGLCGECAFDEYDM